MGVYSASVRCGVCSVECGVEFGGSSRRIENRDRRATVDSVDGKHWIDRIGCV